MLREIRVISAIALLLRIARAWQKPSKKQSQLIEAGFDYVTDMGGYKLFRKRK